MNKAERAALAALLDNVGLGFTKCLAECKLLRAYLQRTQPTAKASATKAFVFNPVELDAQVLCLYPSLIPTRLLRLCREWESATGRVMTRLEIKQHPEMCFRPWQRTWVAISNLAAQSRMAPAKKWMRDNDPADPFAEQQRDNSRDSDLP